MASAFCKFERKRIGACLCLLRVRSGLSLSELSSKVGISPSNLSRIECGKYSVTIDTLSSIVSVLGGSVLVMPNSLIDELFR